MSTLELDPSGRIVSPDGAFSITYNDPFPTSNGNWGFVEPAFGQVFHTEVGYEHNVIDEFNNVSAQASSFFSISAGLSTGIPDGHIHQYGPIGKGWMAWTQASGNPHWRGIENEDGGDPNRPLSTAQIISNAAIFELLGRVDGFPLQPTDDPNNGRGLIFHVDGGGAWGGHDCPGSVRMGQRLAIIYVALMARQPPAPKGGTDMATEVPTGGQIVVRPDGGVYNFNGSRYYGSAGQVDPHKAAGPGNSFVPSHPIVAVASTKTGNGYWLVASDGGVFAFGDAKYHGSSPANPSWLTPVVGIVRDDKYQNGYIIIADAGGSVPAEYACNESHSYS